MDHNLDPNNAFYLVSYVSGEDEPSYVSSKCTLDSQEHTRQMGFTRYSPTA